MCSNQENCQNIENECAQCPNDIDLSNDINVNEGREPNNENAEWIEQNKSTYENLETFDEVDSRRENYKENDLSKDININFQDNNALNEDAELIDPEELKKMHEQNYENLETMD